MRLFLLAFCVIILLPLNTLGQRRSTESPAQLMQSIRQSNADTNRISLQLKLGSFYLFKPGSFRNDMDSTIKYFNEALALSVNLRSEFWKYKALTLIGRYEFEDGHLEKGVSIFYQIISFYHQHKDPLSEARSWKELGNLLYNGGDDDPPRQLACLENAQKILSSIHQDHGKDELDILLAVGNVNVNIGRIDTAESKFLSGIELSKRLPNQYLLQGFESGLAYVWIYKGMFQRALFFELKAITGIAPKDSIGLANAWARTGSIYTYMGMNYDALACDIKALNFYSKAPVATDYYFNSQDNIISNLLALNKPQSALDRLKQSLKKIKPASIMQNEYVFKDFAECYAELNEYQLAGRYFDAMMNNSEQILKKSKLSSYDINGYIIDVCKAIKFFINARDYKRANIYFNRMFTISKFKVLVPEKIDILNLQVTLDSVAGNYKKAFYDLSIYKKINDSVYNSTKSQQIADMQAHYETTEKDGAIKLLQSRSKTQQLQLKTAHLERKVTLGSIAVLLLLTALAYNRYRFKQKTNNELQAKQQEINLKNESLEHLLGDKDKLLADKDWLIKEVHHRVKNNLHTVICLLESQASYLENDALKAIQVSQHRVYAMSLIHQKLYQADDITTIDIASYLKEFIGYLEDSFGTEGTITFKLNLAPLKMSIAQAIPMALIINEAVTNAIKYAFPNSRKGEITISLKEQRDIIEFCVADNGIGIDPALIDVELESLGLALIKGLTTELKGTLDIQNNNGTIVSIVFSFDQILNWPRDFQPLHVAV